MRPSPHSAAAEALHFPGSPQTQQKKHCSCAFLFYLQHKQKHTHSDDGDRIVNIRTEPLRRVVAIPSTYYQIEVSPIAGATLTKPLAGHNKQLGTYNRHST